MKIVITTASPGLDADLDPRFGRGAFLLIVDPDSLQVDAHPNPGVNVTGGAGIQVAQFVAGRKADAVISGDFGPNAFNALKAAGVAMYLFGTCTTARQALEEFKAGRLQKVGAPTQNGHHG